MEVYKDCWTYFSEQERFCRRYQNCALCTATAAEIVFCSWLDSFASPIFQKNARSDTFLRLFPEMRCVENLEVFPSSERSWTIGPILLLYQVYSSSPVSGPRSRKQFPRPRSGNSFQPWFKEAAALS